MDTPGKTSSGVMETDMAQGMPTRLCAMCNDDWGICLLYNTVSIIIRWLEAGGKRVQRVLDDEAAAFRHYMEGTEFLQASLLESMLAQLPDQQVWSLNL